MKRSVCLSVLLVLITSCFHASDKVLESRFYGNYNDFRELVDRLERDRGIRVLGKDDIFYDAGYSMLTDQQLHSYRESMSRLGIIDVTRDNDSSLNFNTSYGGLFVRSSGKGYHYANKRIDNTVSSLDDLIGSDRGDTKTVYKHIEGNWYLAYESW